MRKKATLTITGIILAVLGILFGPGILDGSGSDRGADGASVARSEAPNSESGAKKTPVVPGVDTRVGFTSSRALDEHYEKHGAEFGTINRARYLHLAQELRDAPLGGSVLEAIRADGVTTRFEKKTGAFIAFNPDRTIRTFFRPNDGLRYFERQLDKEH